MADLKELVQQTQLFQGSKFLLDLTLHPKMQLCKLYPMQLKLQCKPKILFLLHLHKQVPTQEQLHKFDILLIQDQMHEQNNPKEWLPALWYLPTSPWTSQMMVNDMVYPDVDYEKELAQDSQR